jgi:putative addiction module component (TIGR02574 family)
MKTLESIAADALELTVEDRLALAEKMVMSIPEDPEIEEAWDKEIRRRIEQYDRGEVTGIPGPEVFRAIREKRKK